VGEEVSLGEVAAEFVDRGQLGVGFDAFGDREDADRVGEVDSVGRDRLVLGVVLNALDEGAVDLDEVDREAA
jgi:hypothetical protein